MALGVVKLTLSQRQILYKTICILLTIVNVSNIAIIILCSYVYSVIAPKIFSERAEINFVFVVIAINSMTIIFIYTLGLVLAKKCLQQPEKKSTKKLVLLWICLSFYLIFTLILLSTFCAKVCKHIVRSIKHSLHLGLRQYLNDKFWKVSIDEMQYKLQCCGIENYEDWYTTHWMTKYHINFNSTDVQSYLDDQNNVPVLPWSCCRLDVSTQCFHDPFQQTALSNSDYVNTILSSIFEDGCLAKLRNPIQSVLVIFILLIFIQVFLEALIVILIRILYTACRNHVLLNDPDGIAPGWIFGRGDCGYTKGKGVYEIMVPN